MAQPEIQIGAVPDTRCDIVPRVSAIFAGACLLLHMVMVFVAGSGMLSMSLPMLGLATLCGGCAIGARRRRCSDRELGLTALMAGAMVSLHLVLMPGHVGQVICGSIAYDPVMANMPGMGDTGGGIFAELLMQAGVAFAGITGLIATGELARRRLAPGRRLRLPLSLS